MPKPAIKIARFADGFAGDLPRGNIALRPNDLCVSRRSCLWNSGEQHLQANDTGTSYTEAISHYPVGPLENHDNTLAEANETLPQDSSALINTCDFQRISYAGDVRENLDQSQALTDRGEEDYDNGLLLSHNRRTVNQFQPAARLQRRLNSIGYVPVQSEIILEATKHPLSNDRIGPPLSHIAAGENAPILAPDANFEEWHLPNATLKRVTVGDRVTFQLQFELPFGALPTEADSALCNRRSTVSLGPRDGSALRRKAIFTSDQDDFLIRLKQRSLPWSEIHHRFNDTFPNQYRTVASLQVHYSTKLNQRQKRKRVELGCTTKSNRPRASRLQELTPDINSDGLNTDYDNDYWEVDKLLAKRRRRGEVSYLVKWADFSEKHNSWVKRHDIDHELVRQFDAQQG